MEIQRENIEVVEGDAPKFGFVVRRTDPNSGALVPWDLSPAGTEVTFTVRSGTQDESPDLALYSTASGSITKTDAPNGVVEVQISTAATGTPGSYKYYLAVVVGGRISTVLLGSWKVLDR